ncbi:mitochondrial ribosomal protein S25 [Kalaharituber pfeilii]|nr:mitochondrial ribosomal protein S25 [Kalaharituber pfeilii]
MGRQLRPLRVHQIASKMLESGRLQEEPAWYRVVGAMPPTTSLVRPLPVRMRPLQPVNTKRAKKAKSNTFRPQEIVYPEDKLRTQFYKDHPWELARPRVVLENDGNDHKNYDWSQLRQPGRQLDGESVIQHQLWLLNSNPYLTTRQAYDIARKKFYQLRLQEDIERRIATEEALAVGAVFDKSYFDIVFEREGQVLQDWKTKAAQDLALRKHKRNAAYSSTSLGEDAAAQVEGAAAEGTETAETDVPPVAAAVAVG